jgi:hypothetical protein
MPGEVQSHIVIQKLKWLILSHHHSGYRFAALEDWAVFKASRDLADRETFKFCLARFAEVASSGELKVFAQAAANVRPDTDLVPLKTTMHKPELECWNGLVVHCNTTVTGPQCSCQCLRLDKEILGAICITRAALTSNFNMKKHQQLMAAT